MIGRRPLLAAGLAASLPALAQEPPRRPPPKPPDDAPLPAESTTRHTLDLPGRTLRFTATAGALPVKTPAGAVQAQVAYTAYALDGAAAPRPVTFAVNGGPGSASGWLQLGALGPWRVAMAHPAPSAAPTLLPNAETWLDFTDLVFLDPPGTGFSPAPAEDARKRLYAVEGDIDALAVVMRRWMAANRRFGAPVCIVGESYGGFRAPRLARALADEQGIGVRGLVLVSPALDLTGRHLFFDPLSWAVRLPVLAATRRAQDGTVTRADLKDVESYALGDYLSALLRGESDPQGLAQMESRVAALTGLDPAAVARFQGRVGRPEVLREIERRTGRVPSPYDAAQTLPDPFPAELRGEAPDPVLDGLAAPVTGAMLSLYGGTLNWQPDAPYRLLDADVSRQWEWGRRPESVTALRAQLALDDGLRVLVAHGLFDLVTPWLATSLLLDGIAAGADRVRLVTYPAGHMVYTADAGRVGLRADAREQVFG